MSLIVLVRLHQTAEYFRGCLEQRSCSGIADLLEIVARMGLYVAQHALNITGMILWVAGVLAPRLRLILLILVML